MVDQVTTTLRSFFSREIEGQLILGLLVFQEAEKSWSSSQEIDLQSISMNLVRPLASSLYDVYGVKDVRCCK